MRFIVTFATPWEGQPSAATEIQSPLLEWIQDQAVRCWAHSDDRVAILTDEACLRRFYGLLEEHPFRAETR